MQKLNISEPKLNEDLGKERTRCRDMALEILSELRKRQKQTRSTSVFYDRLNKAIREIYIMVDAFNTLDPDAFREILLFFADLNMPRCTVISSIGRIGTETFKEVSQYKIGLLKRLQFMSDELVKITRNYMIDEFGTSFGY
jgi:hypothetical protein